MARNGTKRGDRPAAGEPAKFTLRFKDRQNHELLRLVADNMGVSMNEVAEDFLARDLRVAALAIEEQLEGLIERLRRYRAKDLERDIRTFAEGEAYEEDPFQARQASSRAEADPLGVIAAFQS